MKEEMNKKDRAFTPQKDETADRSRELSHEDLEGVTGGLRQIVPPSDEKDK